MKLKNHKLTPQECSFAVTESDEENNLVEGPCVFILPFDEYHEAFDNLSHYSLLNPPEYLVNGDWIMENTCVVQGMTVSDIKADMVRLGFTYAEELEE